jgi:cellulose biosynthesis protein BcsQ
MGQYWRKTVTPTFVLTNHKDGVGKSTSATTIALGMVQVLRHLKAPNTRVLLIDTCPSFSLLTEMDDRIRGHREVLDELQSHTTLGSLLCGVIPQNAAVS